MLMLFKNIQIIAILESDFVCYAITTTIVFWIYVFL